MASIKIILYTQKTLSDKTHPIVLQVIHDRQVRKVSLGYSATLEQWDENTNRPNRRHPNYKRLDNFLSQQEAAAKDALLKLQDSKPNFTLDDLMAIIRNEEKKASFFDYTQKLIDDLTVAGKLGNASNYKTMLGVVRGFCQNKDLTFEQINYKWLKSIEMWHLAKGNTYNGLSVYLRAIRAVFNQAIKENLVSRDLYPFLTYRIREEKTKKRAIKRESITQIKELSFPPDTQLWHTRNLFLFSFYTRGMNWIDMAYLQLSNIRDGRITYKRQKTGGEFNLKINQAIQEILDVYTTDKISSDYIFPIILHKTDAQAQRKDIKNGLKNFNKYLNQIGTICGVEGRLTSYVARHSWATIAKQMGYSVEIISDGLGHADTAVTQVYLESFDHSVLDDINDKIGNL